MKIDRYLFESDRLIVRDADHNQSKDLEGISSIMTIKTTNALPPHWQGDYSIERSRAWLEESSSGGTKVLMVLERVSNASIGLVILHEIAGETLDLVDLRLGYVFSEITWGKGYATEVVSALIEWCRRHKPTIVSISGGVADDNIGSRRVLEKNGFMLVPDDGETGECIFKYTLRR